MDEIELMKTEDEFFRAILTRKFPNAFNLLRKLAIDGGAVNDFTGVATEDIFLNSLNEKNSLMGDIQNVLSVEKNREIVREFLRNFEVFLNKNTFLRPIANKVLAHILQHAINTQNPVLIRDFISVASSYEEDVILRFANLFIAKDDGIPFAVCYDMLWERNKIEEINAIDEALIKKDAIKCFNAVRRAGLFVMNDDLYIGIVAKHGKIFKQLLDNNELNLSPEVLYLIVHYDIYLPLFDKFIGKAYQQGLIDEEFKQELLDNAADKAYEKLTQLFYSSGSTWRLF